MSHLSWMYAPLLLMSLWCRVSTELNPVEVVRTGPEPDQQCVSPLMDTEEKLPDPAFSASSVFQGMDNFQPHHARLINVYDEKEHASGFAWCPNNTVHTSMTEWIQVEFSTLVIVGIIFTGGRGNGNVKEFTPSFVLQYQREDGGEWFEHRQQNDIRIIEANRDPRNVVRNSLDPAIVVLRLRIYPYNEIVQQQICLRFALYGCELKDGIIGYDAPEGDRGKFSVPSHLNDGSISQVDFRDTSKEGFRAGRSHQLDSSLGRLVDNIAYLGDILQEHSDPSNFFVGWESVFNSQRTSLQLRFRFDSLRNFSLVRLFSFDSPRRRASLFKQAIIDFSEDGREYPENHRLIFPLTICSTENLDNSGPGLWRGLGPPPSIGQIIRNTRWDEAVVVALPLQGRLGQWVRLDLGFSDSWLLLSEIEFISVRHEVTTSASLPPAKVDLKGPIVSNQKRPEQLPIDEFKDLQKSDRGSVSVHADDESLQSISRNVNTLDGTDLFGPMAPEDFTDGENAAAKHQLVKNANANNRNTTYIIVVIASSVLAIAVLGVTLAFCFHMQIRQNREKQHHMPLKKYAEVTNSGVGGFPLSEQFSTNFPLSGTAVSHAGGTLCSPLPTARNPSYLHNSTFDGNLGTAAVQTTSGGNIGKNPYNSVFQVFPSVAPVNNVQPHPPLSVFAATTVSSVNNVQCDTSAMVSMGTAFQSVPSPGHGFVGGDLNSMAVCQQPVAAAAMFAAMQQMGNQHPALFFGHGPFISASNGAGTGLIHPGGDTTTDSGSLYTTPPDIFGVPLSESENLRCSAAIAGSHFSSASCTRQNQRLECTADGREGVGDEDEEEEEPEYQSSSGQSTSECDESDEQCRVVQGNGDAGRGPTSVERNNVMTSSEGAQLLSKSRRISGASAGVTLVVENFECAVGDEDACESSQNGDCNGCDAGVALLAHRGGRWGPQKSSSSAVTSTVANTNPGKRKRSKRRQRSCVVGSGVAEINGVTNQRRQTTSLQESVMSGCGDSGLGSSRAEVAPPVMFLPPVRCTGRTSAIPSSQLQFIQQQHQQFSNGGSLSCEPVVTEYASASLFGSSTASVSMSLNSGLPSSGGGGGGASGNILASPMVGRHYLPSTSTIGGGSFVNGTCISTGGAATTGAFQVAVDNLSIPGSAVTQQAGFGPLLPRSQYHVYQPFGTILVPTASQGFSGGNIGSLQVGSSSYISPDHQNPHQMGLMHPNGHSIPHFLSQTVLQTEPKKASNHSETGMIPPVVSNNGWLPHSSASCQGSPPDACSIAAQHWSTTLKTKQAGCGYPLPPIPSLPMPLVPPPPPPPGLHNQGTVSGDCQRDGTSSGRLSIYSVCM